MKKNHSCNALKALKIIRIILSIILLSYTLSLCIIGHCASASTTTIPFNINNVHGFGNVQNINSLFDVLDKDTFITTAVSGLEGQTYTSYIGFISDVGNNPFSGNPQDIYVVFILDPFVDYDVARDLDFSSTTVTVSGSKIYNVDIRYQWDDGGTYYMRSSGNIGGNNLTRSLLGTPQVITKTLRQGEFNYSPNYPFFSYGLGDTGVLSNNDISVIVDRTIPIIPDNDSAEESMEMPQISDYTPEWTNTPTFDNSSVENALQSVYNGIIWLANNIKDTITGTAEYIADTVRWSIQKVINTIRETLQAVQNKIDDVKNAVLTVVDKIQDFFDYVSQPYDSTKINTAFNNMAIKTDYNNMTTLVNNAFSVFNNTDEPNTFRIPIHLENIPILHLNTVQYIDLGWIYDSRSLIRAFMWCVTTFGLLYTICDALPSYLQGNDE